MNVPLEATDPAQWREDPWSVAAKTFAASYIGGWSACEHWGLTEQIFREIVVFTTRRVRYRQQDIQGTPFRLVVIPPKKLFGTKTVWRGKTRIEVSDASRTVLDILDSPELGGGIRHVADVLATYFESENRNDDLLMTYAERLGNRAVYKRLGYLTEKLSVNAPTIIATCLEKKSTGLAILDPSVRAKGKIIRRWNLRVNVHMERDEQSA